MNEKFIFFYGKESPFSNWHEADFVLDGVTFNCCEKYMIYRKALLFKDQQVANQILETDSQREQKALGRKVTPFDKEIWEANCKQIVYEGNKAKFLQNDHLLNQLLKTADHTLVEASPRDTIWGIGLSAKNPKALSRHTWRGKNWLGEILTKLRNDLIAEGYALQN